MKTVTLEELIELARASGISDAKVQAHVRAIEQVMAVLAVECAERLGIEHRMTRLDEAGLCSSFGPLTDGQPSPEFLDTLDQGGLFVRE